MANPFAPYSETTPENGTVDIFFECNVVDGVGTPGTVAAGTAAGGREFAAVPITRTGAGAYTVSFIAAWVRMLDYDISVVGPNATTTGKWAIVIADNSTNTATPGINIVFTRSDTGAVAEVQSGDVIKICLTLKAKTP